MANNKPIEALTDPRLNVTVHPKQGAFQCIEITPKCERPDEERGGS